MIHPSTCIDPSAVIADDVVIGPWTQIGPNVVIDPGCRIGPHVIIDKNTRIGTGTHIFSHVVLGSDPQHLDYQQEETWLVIGEENVIREFVTINRGTKGGTTVIGGHNYLMSYSHIAHDCNIGSHIIFANTASVAGHVEVGDYAILGAFSGVHQFVKIGAYSFLGRATKIYQDILPYMLATGNPGAPRGINTVGLRRHGFSAQQRAALKQAFSIIYRQGLLREQMIEALSALNEQTDSVQPLIDAIVRSERGIARATAPVHSNVSEAVS